MLNVLNLGAGVQSSTILLMAIEGELPAPDHCIFADTGNEPMEVYEWLRWLELLSITKGISIHRVKRSGPGIYEHIMDRLRDGKSIKAPPLFTRSGKNGRGQIKRSCTTDFKIEPIKKKKKELLGLSAASRWPKDPAVCTWLGISADEVQRMKADDPRHPWETFWHPLIESAPGEWRDHAMSREDCYDWLRLHDYPTPPRSACIICPYHSNMEWRHIRKRPDEWSQAVKLDRALRQYGVPRVKELAYLHSSLEPLENAPIDSSDAGQASIWDNECSGVCGV